MNTTRQGKRLALLTELERAEARRTEALVTAFDSACETDRREECLTALDRANAATWQVWGLLGQLGFRTVSEARRGMLEGRC